MTLSVRLRLQHVVVNHNVCRIATSTHSNHMAFAAFPKYV